MDDYKKIQQLKDFFEKEKSVVLAFLFGSKAKGVQKNSSDWDIAAYFTPHQYCELETKIEYPEEHKVWENMEKILETNDVDFLILNRSKPSLVFSILNSGIPLVIRDQKLYLKLLIKTHYEAIDYWNFTKDFFEIAERAKSISGENKAILREHIRFLENEFSDLKKFKDLTIREYTEDRDKRRNVERWAENLVVSAIDIAKIVLAGEKREIPQTYRETLFSFVLNFMDEDSARRFSQFSELRNIVVHEYLDIKWEKIKKFIEDAERFYPVFIEKTKEIL